MHGTSGKVLVISGLFWPLNFPRSTIHGAQVRLQYIAILFRDRSWYSHLHSRAVITRSNIVNYYINNYRNWGRISIRCWILIPRPNGRVMGCVLWIFVRKLTALSKNGITRLVWYSSCNCTPIVVICWKRMVTCLGFAMNALQSVMSHERHGVSDNRNLNCLFNSIRLTTKTTKLRITGLLWALGHDDTTKISQDIPSLVSLVWPRKLLVC